MRFGFFQLYGSPLSRCACGTQVKDLMLKVFSFLAATVAMCIDIAFYKSFMISSESREGKSVIKIRISYECTWDIICLLPNRPSKILY